MITPLMHILSCLNEKWEVEPPVDILYLNRQDRGLIVSEAKRLGTLLRDSSNIWVGTSDTGLDVVQPTQIICGEPRNINPYTALLLTRVMSCIDTYLREVDSAVASVHEEDLSTDAVVLRLEGSPRYIYLYVYNIMEMPSLTYEGKIARLKELLLTIKTHVAIESNDAENTRMLRRMELQSDLSYWQGMLMSDYVKYNGSVPPDFDAHTVEEIKSDLKNLGIYGFVNPLQMYQDFSTARVSRKVLVQVEDWVVDFLSKIVLSGGAVTE